MLFTSLAFFIFLAVVLVIYYIVPKKAQWVILLCASLFFYTAFSWKFLFFIIFTIITIYFAGKFIEKLSNDEKQFLESNPDLEKEEKKKYKNNIKKKKKTILIITIVVNIGILAVLKYANFFIFNYQALISLFGVKQDSLILNLILPLGISFYTFQSVGYLVDVYWGKVKAQQNIFKLGLFVSFFPQIIEGPISRYGDLWDKELDKQHKFEYENIARGLLLILWGLFKKLVIADGLYPTVDTIFSHPEYSTSTEAFLGTLFYFVQDYADFSGCIDIAIGAALCFGVHLPQNFNHPYFSRTIPEYWRRWHITLGTWFKDYIFYPLSVSKFSINLGKKCKKFMKTFGKMVPGILGLILVWFITGLWHGASWTYILWGLYYGFVIILGVVFEPLSDKVKAKFKINVNAFWYKFFQWFRTICILIVGRVIFRAPTLAGAFTILGTMLTLSNYGNEVFVWFEIFQSMPVIIACIGTALLLAVDLWQEFHPNTTVRDSLLKKPIVVRYLVYLSLIVIIVLFGCYGPMFENIDFEYMKF